MATEANKLKVGAFLIVGFLAFNAALVWIGASHVLEKTQGFVTYFDESVNGLEVGAAVKFRGVPIGRVGDIQVAPDGRLVQADLDIASGFAVPPGLRASLATSGLTGVSVVELGFPSGDTAPPPALQFTPPARYIPSQPSVLARVTEAAGRIAAGFHDADLPGLVADYRAAAVEGRRVLAGPELRRAVAGIAGAADEFHALGRRLSALADDPRLAQLPARLDAAAQRTEGAAGAAQALFGDPRLARILDDAAAAAAGARETTAAATRAAARWERLGADLDRSALEALARLEQAAARMEGLAASVEANPSRLLEKPPKEDFR